MIKLYTTIFVTFLFLQSCSTRRVEKMSGLGIDLQESELLALSKDCKLLRKKIKKGLVEFDGSNSIGLVRTTFLQNDFLVSLLSRTDCFDGYSSEQLIGIFGDAIKRPFEEDSSKFLLEYYFEINEMEGDFLTMEFKNDRLISFKVKRANLIIIYN